MCGANPSWLEAATPFAPDGDAEVAGEAVKTFAVPACLRCGGALKPRVVFVGENVARELVAEAFACVDDADALLIAGTSLAVFSPGYRFLRRARDNCMPIAIVGRGPLRGEEHAVVKIEASTGGVLREIADRRG